MSPNLGLELANFTGSTFVIGLSNKTKETSISLWWSNTLPFTSSRLDKVIIKLSPSLPSTTCEFVAIILSVRRTPLPLGNRPSDKLPPTENATTLFL